MLTPHGATLRVLYVRFAPIVILCNSPRAGERILASVTRYLKRSLKLIVNETKSKVVTLSEATFLGFSIVHRKIRWTQKSQKKFKAEVRRLTQRTRGHSPVKVIADLQAYLRGAVNYYRVKRLRLTRLRSRLEFCSATSENLINGCAAA